MSDIEDEPPPVLLPCSICSRTFRPDVLERHSRVCEKTASKKRKVFDSFKSRVSGTELEEFLGPAPLPGQAPKRPEKSPVKKPKGRPKWKETHENLIAILRAARGAATVDPAVVLAPKTAGNEQCPSCGRFFGPRAFDRHVQFCKEKTSRIKLTPSKVSLAQERLEARTKYKAPLSLKPKLTTKEKYSPMPARKVDSSETGFTISSSKTPSSVNKITKPSPAKAVLTNFSRQSPARSSERQRSVSPKKPLSSTPKVTREAIGKQSTQPKIKDNLKDPEDFRPRTGMKIPARQDKIRNPSRKMSQFDEDSPEWKKKLRNRKLCISSDEGNETDSLNSSGGNNKDRKKLLTESLPGSPERKVGPVRKEVLSSPCNDGSRSSRHGKAYIPVTNDLSVNDESFGIHVAPCPQRSSSQGKTTKPRKSTETSKQKKLKEIKESPKMVLEVIIPSVPQCRSSRIPKRVNKGGDFRQEEEELLHDKPLEDDTRKDRERTAVIKKDKFRKWHDLSDVCTDDLLHMADDFDFISEFDDLQLKNDLEAEDSEMEEISRSTLWELTGEEYLKSDDSVEYKAEVSDSAPNETKEDEFIVLHLAEPKKLTDDDMEMKLSISEPCFKTNYLDPKAMLKAMKANPDIFVFDSTPRFTKKMTSFKRRRKVRITKKIKTTPRTLTMRERTFLANYSPRVKMRKLSGKDEAKLSKIKNLNDYFFGFVSQVRETDKNFGKKSLNVLSTPSNGDNVLEQQIKVIQGEGQKDMGDIPERNEKHGKKFEYFEIGKDFEDDPSDATIEGHITKESDVKIEPKNRRKVKMKENFSNRRINEADGEVDSSIPNDKNSIKCTICYSDEEFEKLRQNKEKRLNELKPIDSFSNINDLSEDLPSARTEVVDSALSVDANEIPKLKSLENIAEEEEHLESTARSIEIEDFIIKKPNKTIIMSKSGNCLEELFPSAPQMVELKPTDSKTAVPLRYVVNSLYDLKEEERVKAGPLRNINEKNLRLPEVNASSGKKSDKRNSISSLVQKWKTRKQKIEDGTLYESLMLSTEKNKRQKKNYSFQIALLPIVLTHKLRDIAVQFDNAKPKDENYDPFKQAERQMIALLSWPSTADLKTVNDNSQTPKIPTPYSPNLGTPHKSAFTKYPSKDENSPEENGNHDKAQKRTSDKRKSDDYTPVYSAADDWEQIFEKHFDLNRNEMNEKMPRSVKSALDGLLKNSSKNYFSENENTPPENEISRLSELSAMDDVVYTSTPKRPSSRMSGVAELSMSPEWKTVTGHRKSSKSSYGRVTPPDDLSDSMGGRKSNRNSGVSLSSMSFCSQASDTTLADEEIMRTNLEIVGIGKSTPRTGKRRFARSQSVFDERNKMLFAKTFDSHFSSSDENEMLPTINDHQGKKSAINTPYPKSVPSSRFPRSQSVMDGRCRGDGDHFEERDLVSSPEGSKGRKAKMSGDSAYSSLNRRSPRSGVQNNLQEDRLSSSGSEHSLPPLSNDHALKPVSLNFDNTTSTVSSKKEQPYKMSKFCHECGSKYPVAVAKFCCECGVRRLII